VRCSSASRPCSCNWAGPRCKSARAATNDIATRKGGKKSRCPVIPIRMPRYPASGGRVGLAARASSRGQGTLSAAVGTWAGLCRRWQRAGRRLSSGGLGVCVSHPSDHRRLATLERAGLRERPRSGGDARADRPSAAGGRAAEHQPAAGRCTLCRWATVGVAQV